MADVPGWVSPGDEPAPAPGSAPPAPPAWGQSPPAWGQSPPAWGQPPPAWGQPPAPSGQQPGWGPAPGWQPGTAWSGAPAAARPGVIPLRPLGIGEILDGAITTVRRYPAATLGMSAAVVTVVQVVQFFALRPFAASFSTADGFTGTGSAGLVFGLMFGLVSSGILSGALTVVIGQAVLGRPIALQDAVNAVRARFWALIGTSLLVAVLTGIAFVLLVLPFFYAWPVLSLATPALMLERQTVWNAIRRSAALVKGQFWRCLGVVALAWLIKTFVGAAISTPFVLIGGGFDQFIVGTQDTTADLSTTDLAVNTLGNIISGTFVAPFSAAVSALLYVDRRMRAEGLDVALAAAAATAGPPPA